MSKKVLILAALAIFCFEGLIFAQNANSSTTMEPNHNMSGMSMHGRRHRRRHHRRRHMHRRRGTANKNANTQ